MAGAFGFDMEEQPFLPPTRCIQIFETNYNFEKQLEVQGFMTVGELAVAMVKEIGKSNHVLTTFLTVLRCFWRRNGPPFWNLKLD